MKSGVHPVNRRHFPYLNWATTRRRAATPREYPDWATDPKAGGDNSSWPECVESGRYYIRALFSFLADSGDASFGIQQSLPESVLVKVDSPPTAKASNLVMLLQPCEAL